MVLYRNFAKNYSSRDSRGAPKLPTEDYTRLFAHGFGNSSHDRWQAYRPGPGHRPPAQQYGQKETYVPSRERNRDVAAASFRSLPPMNTQVMNNCIRKPSDLDYDSGRSPSPWKAYNSQPPLGRAVNHAWRPPPPLVHDPYQGGFPAVSETDPFQPGAHFNYDVYRDLKWQERTLRDHNMYADHITAFKGLVYKNASKKKAGGPNRASCGCKCHGK